METSLLRILDANLNRAREALRVIEDYARFALDDADAATQAKRQRHLLRRIAQTLGARRLLSARDIAGDVGREAKLASELERGTSLAVVQAAFARLSEAARVLSEYAKLLDATAAELAERLRYQSYELEQSLLLRAEPRARFRDVSLYVIITEALCRRDWLEASAAALRGGARCLQLREKNLPDAELLRRARRLRELTRRHDALLIINDRPDIARLCGADGVHLGQDDLPVAEARRIAGPGLMVGKSTHTRQQFEAALAERPDYLAVGPMFATTTKPQQYIAGPKLLAEIAPLSELPLVAIGGITAENVAQVTSAGACCVCVCSAVIGTDDPQRAAAEILANATPGAEPKAGGG